MEQTLAHCVQYSLQNFLYENATFMAERLYAQEKSDLAQYLLASCYFKAGQFYKVCALLKGSTYDRNRYLHAMAAYRMGKHREAELALTEQLPSPPKPAQPGQSNNAGLSSSSGLTSLHSASVGIIGSGSTSAASSSAPHSATATPGSMGDESQEKEGRHELDQVPNGAAGLFLLGQICR